MIGGWRVALLRSDGRPDSNRSRILDGQGRGQPAMLCQHHSKDQAPLHARRRLSRLGFAPRTADSSQRNMDTMRHVRVERIHFVLGLESAVVSSDRLLQTNVVSNRSYQIVWHSRSLLTPSATRQRISDPLELLPIISSVRRPSSTRAIYCGCNQRRFSRTSFHATVGKMADDLALLCNKETEKS